MKITVSAWFAFAMFAVAVPTGIAQAGVIQDASLVVWWDASDINNDGGATNPANGATVTNWQDKSGNNRHLNQGAGGTYNTAAIGGQPAIEFSTAQWLDTTAVITAEQLTGANRNEITVFMVMNRQGGVVWTKWETNNQNRVGFEGANRWDFAVDAPGVGQLNGADVSNRWVVHESLQDNNGPDDLRRRCPECHASKRPGTDCR